MGNTAHKSDSEENSPADEATDTDGADGPRVAARVEISGPDGSVMRLEGEAALRYLDDRNVIKETQDRFDTVLGLARAAEERMFGRAMGVGFVVPSVFDDGASHWGFPGFMPPSPLMSRMLGAIGAPPVFRRPSEDPPREPPRDDTASRVRDMLAEMASDENASGEDRAAAQAALDALGPSNTQ